MRKGSINRLGDATGSNVWGNCVDKAPYSVADCIAACYTPIEVKCNAKPLVEQDACYKAASEQCTACYPQCNEDVWTTSMGTSPLFDLEMLTTANGMMKLEMETYLQQVYTNQLANSATLPSYSDSTGARITLDCAMNKTCGLDAYRAYVRENFVGIIVYAESLEQLVSSEAPVTELSGLTSGVYSPT